MVKNLPPELHQQIFETIASSDPSSLFTLLKVSRIFRSRLLCSINAWKKAAWFLIENDVFYDGKLLIDDPFIIFSAINLGNISALQALIYAGYNVNIQLSPYEFTPLLLAVSIESIPATRLLLTANVDSSLVDRQGFSVIHKAAQTGNSEIFNLLLQYDLNPNTTSKSGHTPLHFAAKYGHHEIVKTLLANKCELKTNAILRTPLHEASLNQSESASKIVELLLNYDPNPNNPDKNGQTPLHLSSITGCAATTRILVSQPNIEIDFKDSLGCTALHHAVINDNPLVCQILVSAGADIHAVDYLGNTPVDELVAENLSMYDMGNILVDTRVSIGKVCWYSSFAYVGMKLAGL